MEIPFVIVLMVLAVVLFITEKFPPAATALLVLGLLLLCGEAGRRGGWLDGSKWVNTAEAFSGFCNPAVVAVAAMFVLSAALERHGLVAGAAVVLGRMGRSPGRLLVAIMLLAAAVSAFANNTAAVAALLPAVMALCAQRGLPASRFLIPLSFAAQFGGVCTLVGTSTNLLVNDLAVRAGRPEFGFFEFTPLGLVMTAAGVAYFLLAGNRLLPERVARQDGTGDDWEPGDFVSEVRVLPDSPAIGQTVAEAGFVSEGRTLQVLELIRDGVRCLPSGQFLRSGDVLLVRAEAGAVEGLRQKLGLALNAEHALRRADLEQDDLLMAQALVSPGSRLQGRTLAEVRFQDQYDSIVLGIRSRWGKPQKSLAQWRLRVGDMLLLLTSRKQLDVLRSEESLIVLRDKEARPLHGWRTWTAAGIFAAVVLGAAVFRVPVAVAAVIGCGALLVSGCLRLEQAVAAVNWQVILLLACLLPLGLTLEKSGAAELMADLVVGSIGSLGPVALLAGIYLLTAILTEFMSNNAAALLLAPVALSTAERMGIDPRPLLIAVTFAASTSFATPVGYQTNTMIYGPGGYRFTDFLRVGVPLNILFWLLAVWLIPLWWPF